MSEKPAVEFHAKPRRHYLVNGQKVPSVTQVLSILDKPALVGWAARETVDGCWKLARRSGYSIPDSPVKFSADLKRFELDYRSTSADASGRGTAIHDTLEAWINDGKIPNPGDYPASWRGYFRALAAWLMDARPDFLESEKVVGSAVHGFAGTRDTVARVNVPGRGRVLFDLKTSKRCYARTHFRQLAAYELAGVECGEDPTDAQAIVILRENGTWDYSWSFAAASDFLNVLRVWRDDQPFQRAERER